MVDQLFKELVVDIIEELNGIPVFVIHVKTRNNGGVSFSQIKSVSRVAFKIDPVKIFNID